MLAVTFLLLLGCVSPQSQRSAVRYVEFDASGDLVEVGSVGPNTIGCQDYWQKFTLWDHAVIWPNQMSSEDANAVCRSSEEMSLETGPVKSWQVVTGSVEQHHTNDALVRSEANQSALAYDIKAR